MGMGRFRQTLARYAARIDWILVLLCVALSGFGMAVIYSATRVSSGRAPIMQALGICLGLVLMFTVSCFDADNLMALWKIYVPVCLLLMVLTFFFGYTPAGTDNKAWLYIGGVSLQPSELLKLAFILTLSNHIGRLGDRIRTFKGVLSLVVHAAIPIGLVLLQKDWGTMLIFVFIFLTICFVGGVQLRYFAIAAGVVAAAVPPVWIYLLKGYQKKRILAVYFPELDPDYDYIYQQWMGKISIGSGELTGRGWMQGPRTQAGIVPEQRNDFILSVLGEEFGFLGCALVLALLFTILMFILRAALRAPDVRGKCVCMGVFAVIAGQALVNIGMVLSLLPVIGVGLPFFSSGGTSVMMSFIGIGMVQSVYAGRKRYTFFNRVIRS